MTTDKEHANVLRRWNGAAHFLEGDDVEGAVERAIEVLDTHEAEVTALRYALDWWVARSVNEGMRQALAGQCLPLDPQALLADLDERYPEDNPIEDGGW